MEIVSTPAHFPGSCLLTGTHQGPFIDLLGTTRSGERQYIAVALVREMAAKIGFVDRGDLDVALNEVARLRAELDGAEKMVEAATADLAALQASVRQTLAAGAVRRADDSFKLRAVPGQRAVDIGADDD